MNITLIFAHSQMLRLIRLFLILLLPICTPLKTHASDDAQDLIKELFPKAKLSNAELNLIKEELKVRTLVIESVLELENRGVRFNNYEEITSSISKVVSQAAATRSMEFGVRIQNNVSEIIQSSLDPRKMGKQITKVTEFILNDLLTKKGNIISLTRRYGFQVGLVYLATMQIDYTLPLYLIASGTSVKLGAALFATPISSTTTASFAYIKSTVKYYHMIRKLGYKVTMAHLKGAKKIRSFLNRNMFSTDSIVDLFIRDKHYLVSTLDPGAMKSIFRPLLNKLGFRQELTYQNLIDFLKQEKLLQHKVYVLEQTSMAQYAKLLEILKEIEFTGNSEIIAKLEIKFGKKIQTVSKSFPSLNQTHLEWFMRAGHATSIDELFDLLKVMPRDIAPHTFGKVWRNHTMGMLSQHLNLNISFSTNKAFQNLRVLYEKDLNPLLTNSTYKRFKGNTRRLFINYIYEALSPVGSCGQIFRKKKGSKKTPFLIN